VVWFSVVNRLLASGRLNLEHQGDDPADHAVFKGSVITEKGQEFLDADGESVTLE